MGTMNENETTMNLKGYVNVVNHSGQDFQNAQTRIIVGQTRLTEEITWLASRYYPYGPDIPSEDDNIHLGIVNEELSDLKQKVPPLLKGIPVIGRLVSNKDFDGFSGGTSLGYELKDIEKEGLSEYFLYTIEGTEDLPNAWAKRLQSFDVTSSPSKVCTNTTKTVTGQTRFALSPSKTTPNMNWATHPSRKVMSDSIAD